MLIQKSILQSKVKSHTNDGNLAITRCYAFREKNKDYTGLSFTMIYFSSDIEITDEYVRRYKDKFVYKREYTIKLSTLIGTLANLEYIDIQ